jgi:hypothetical protein
MTICDGTEKLLTALVPTRLDGVHDLLGSQVRRRVLFEATEPFSRGRPREISLEDINYVAANAASLVGGSLAQLRVQVLGEVLDLDRTHGMRLAC